ncbi:hypothetical protein AALO_G00172560 [Alosa alosa]|uniref:Uncharacterized protein n=1 Tax=Alosa alosa TaxID=278164 RepID=A0AAV6G776_9TELE|nr:hypothetical protein AALO_G00172560 [Alosa alosa]
METRRTNLTHADTLRTAERGGHDVSPHATRRASERPRDPEPDARGWNRERELSFTTFKGRGGEAERDRRREQETPKRPNGRLLSMLESGPVVDLEGERAKGDTFPRMRKPSREPDRRANIIPEHERKRRDWEVERGTGTSQERQARTGRGGDRSRESDREMAQRRDKDIQRYREEERRRKRERGQLIEDWKQNVQRSLEREQVRAYDPSGQERRRERNPEGNDPRGPREMERERGRPRESDRANRSYSPRRQRATEEESGMDRPRGGNKEYMREGRRDARSEGESDGGNRGNVSARVEYTATLQHKHSRSEGDNEGDERRERERQRDRERERERETGRNRDGYYERDRPRGRGRDGYERDRPRGRGRDTDRAVDKRRDEFSDTLRRGRDDRSGREREGGRPYPRDENVGRRREGERPAEREREQRRPRERAREGEDGGSPSPRSAQFRTQPSSDQLRAQSWASSSGELRVQSRASSSGEWMSGGSDLENERRRRGARDGNEGRETGQEGTPERERRRPREPVQGEHKRPESQDTTAQEGERRSVTGQDDREKKNEMDKMGADRDERAGERPEGRTMRRMWLVPGSERTRASRESSQEEELLVSMREAAAREPEAASQGLQDKYRMLERTEEFAGNRGRDGGGPEEGGGSESGSTDEREANVTEESDREREEGSEGLSDGEVLGVWRTSPSVEDGFVTVSSGGEEEEDNFEDCKEFWDGGVRDDSTRQSQRGHERQRGGETGDVTRTTSDRDKAGTVFCVVGNKLPRKELHSRRAYLDLDNLESMPAVRTDYSKLKYNNRRSLDLTGDGTPKQEPTLSKDRDQDDGAESPNTQDAEKEPERQSLSNEHVQEEVTASSDDQINANSSPEPTAHPPVGTDEPGGLEDYGYAVIKDGRQEAGPTAEQPSGDGEIWATAQEMKRHSQAPHLKWAKSVVREILGYTDDPGLEAASEARTKRPADPNQGSEGLPVPGPMPMPVYITVQKRLEARDSDSEPQPPLGEEEEEEKEPARWEEPRGSVVHAGSLTHVDVHADMEAELHGESETHLHGEDDTREIAVETDTQTGASTHTHTHIEVEEDKKAREEEVGAGEGEGSAQEANTDSEAKSTEAPSQSRDSSVEREAVAVAGEGEGGGGRGGEGGGVAEIKKGEKCVILSTNSFRDLGTEARLRRRGIRKTEKKERREEEEEEEEEGEGGEVSRDRRTRVFASEEENDDMRFSWNEVELRKVVDSIGRTTKKRNSKFFNSQLYQQYSEVVLNREILRQSDADTLPTHPASPCAPAAAAVQPSPAQRPLPPIPPLPHPLPSSGALSGGASTLTVPQLPPRPPSPRVSISSQTQSLWQELPSVRNSIELEEMSEDQRRLQEVRFEVVTSEASYSRSLDIVVEHFVKCKDLESFLTGQDRNWLFSRLVDVRAISHSFLTKLEERVENNTLHFDVCDIITRHCQMFRMVYVPYLTNQSYQDKTYQRLMDENPSFKRCVEKLERSPVCQRLPLRSFLILPFQRITRLKLLVQNIVKRTAPKSDDEAQAIKAMKLLEKIIQDSNDSITQMKSIESLVSLSAKVDFECKTLPLISQSRRMVREGMVTELMDFSMKETERSVYIHLFNDYLLLSLPKEGGRFTVIDHAPVAELRAENCRVKLHSLKKNVFRLYLSRKMLLLRTGTLSDKLRWISAISSPHPEMDFTAAQDFPQMQCIRALVAQQPDELGLEKADVLLVHQESSDGWVEGTRMSDRHRGWAPKSHLESITNEKARQRNLMDIHKITTATAAL